jgi:hypothetical protein
MPIPPSPGAAHPFDTASPVPPVRPVPPVPPVPPASAVSPVFSVALAGSSLVAAAAVGSIFLSTARDAWTAIAAAGPAGPADGILLVAALGGMLLSLWLGLGLTLSALSALPGAIGHSCRRLAGRIAPAAVRKVVAFVLGTTLTAAVVPGSAVASTDHGAPRPALVASARHVTGAVRFAADAAPDASFRLVSEPIRDTDNRHDRGSFEAAPPPLWSPERPGSPMPAPKRVPVLAADRIVVHRGDTLWSIAAPHLDAGASTAEIDAECHRWFAANRTVIGDDANLILPGQRLSPPPSPRGNS